ncbi:MAG: ABC transporter substrate-binding protein [Phycisphaerales bacterium]|nr:ABC transporter substrate-binding protein [Phycisphaerales bacterium]
MLRWLLLLLLLLHGCGDTPSPAPDPDSPRIISLSPAITRALEDAGLAPHLVGRSTWCRLRDDRDVPAVGDLHDRDWEGIIRLQPTHVFFQSEDVETDASLVDLAEANGWTLRAWPLRTTGEVRDLFMTLPSAFVGLDTDTVLDAQCRELANRIDDALVGNRMALERRVLLVSDGVPPLAWGEQTYLGELLLGIGGVNALGDAAWKTVSLEDVVRLAPDVIIVISETDDPSPPAIAELDIAAVTEGRVHRLVHEDINLPGAHLADLVPMLRRQVTGP